MQEALKYHSDVLKQTLQRIRAWVDSGCANACPIAAMQAHADKSENRLTVAAEYSAMPLAAGEAPSWNTLRRGALAQALLQMTPAKRVLWPGVQGRLQFRDLLDHVRSFAHTDDAGSEAIWFEDVRPRTMLQAGCCRTCAAVQQHGQCRS